MDPLETHGHCENDYTTVIIYFSAVSFTWVHNFAFSKLVWSVTTYNINSANISQLI